jgi:hypothetical protein
MSTIKSSDEHLTLNADGTLKDIKFQANGVEKASISSSGAFTSTTIDATKLTGDLPAISGANLTGVGVAGITSTADATAMTIDSSENVGFGVVPKTWHSSYKGFQIDALSLMAHKTTPTVHTMGNAYHNGSNYKYVITGVATQHSMEGGDHVFRTAASGSADANITWTDQLSLKADGRGLSQFTAKAWASWNLNGTASIHDSHNVSSLSDNGTGDSTIFFANNMANTNYAVAGMSDDTFRGLSLRDQSYTATAYTRFASWISSNTTYDDAHRLMAVWFGD